MTAIQAVYVRGHEERSDPKPHIVYRIEIQAHVRSWQMWRRYSEFVELHTELTKSTGSSPPAPLPPKNALAIFRGPFRDSTSMIEERQAGLETYLRAIISAKDDKWRECYALRDFLGVPVGRLGTMPEGSTSKQFSSSSWLDEHLGLQAKIRDIRADINKRDALSDRGDVSASHTANVQAKKKLAEALSRVRTLTQGLQELGMAAMAEGELQRRTDMVARLQDDCEKLGKMVTVTRQPTRPTAAPSSQGFTNVTIVPESDRAALLSSSKPITRVFGAKKPQETEMTRPLDDQGLVQLQKTQMEQQESQLAALTPILQRQRHLGEAISAELAVHNELLDELNNDVDRVGGKLISTKKQLNRLG
ncbi:PX domain-containing protein [Suillus paluster]|uniref:PX domain-containing protein n=1 Tax=Suillus paluster TaxID=48578 RepID=UPI001B872E6B|nr:PX domain-containing protein [Suillus paluster]KAG1755220.1 Phox homologous domain-containing protein [Suillus paluster]